MHLFKIKTFSTTNVEYKSERNKSERKKKKEIFIVSMPNFSSILFSLCLFPIRKTIAIDDENTCVERPQMCARRTKWEVVEYIASSLPHTHFKWHSLDSHSLSSNSYSKGKIGCVVEMENVRGSEWESSELKEREREKNFNNTRGASQVAVKSVCCCCCCWWWDFSSYLHKFASSFFLHVVIISNASCLMLM